MAASFNFTPDKRIPLTEAEYNMLADMLAKGDRAGFYMAYYAMTNNVEALLTSKVSTFSETIGGVAFTSNWLMQDRYRAQGPTGSAPYQGIYYLSQKVAEGVRDAIHADMLGNDTPEKKDAVEDGMITPNRVLVGAADAWKTAENLEMFPGNYPIAYGLYTIPGWSAGQAAASVGFDASVMALLYASYFGKQQSDMTGSTISDAPNGRK